MTLIQPSGCWSKVGTQNETLINGTKDYLRFSGGFIWTHTRLAGGFCYSLPIARIAFVESNASVGQAPIIFLFFGVCPTKMVQAQKGSLFFPGSLNN